MGSAPVYTGETRTYLTSNLTSPSLGSHPLLGSQGLVNCVFLCQSPLTCSLFLLPPSMGWRRAHATSASKAVDQMSQGL